MNKAALGNWLTSMIADFETEEIEARSTGQDIEADMLEALKWHTSEILDEINSGKFDH